MNGKGIRAIRRGRYVVVSVGVLLTVVACGCVASASAAGVSGTERTDDLSTSRGGIPDVTEMWSSPGAVWIARQLRQVEFRLGNRLFRT